MFALGSGQNGGDLAVLAIEREAALLVVPSETGKAPFDGAYHYSRDFTNWRSHIRQLEAYHLGQGGQGIRAFHPAPPPEVLPVRSIGLIGVLGRRCLGVVSGGIDQAVQCARPGGGGGKVIRSLVSFMMVTYMLVRIKGRRPCRSPSRKPRPSLPS